MRLDMNDKLFAGVAGLSLLAMMTASVAAAEPAASFDGAALGMSISDWKALSPPAGVGSDAAPTCVPVTGTGHLPGPPLSAVSRPTDEEACAYDSRFGHDVLPHSIRLDARYRASGLRYLFVAGRLDEIDFDASVDAYSDVMAMLKQDFGAPTRTVRDSVRTSMGPFPRVRQTWRTPGGDINLVDPALDPVQLSVRFTAVGQPTTRGPPPDKANQPS
jgi:hypothetical protein